MSNIKKTIGESPLRGTPKQKINLIIGDGKIKSRHIGNKQVTLEKLADEVMEEFQERISSHEETGIYVSNSFGESTGVAISQKVITEKIEEIEAAIASIDSNSGGHNILPFDGFLAVPVSNVSSEKYTYHRTISPGQIIISPLKYTIVANSVLNSPNKFYLKVEGTDGEEDTYYSKWEITTDLYGNGHTSPGDPFTTLEPGVVSKSEWYYREYRINKLFYNRSNKVIYAYEYATTSLTPITNIQVVETNAPQPESTSNPDHATKGSIVVDLENDKMLTWDGQKWKALSGGGSTSEDVPNHLAVRNGILYLERVENGETTQLSHVVLPNGGEGGTTYDLVELNKNLGDITPSDIAVSNDNKLILRDRTTADGGKNVVTLRENLVTGKLHKATLIVADDAMLPNPTGNDSTKRENQQNNIIRITLDNETYEVILSNTPSIDNNNSNETINNYYPEGKYIAKRLSDNFLSNVYNMTTKKIRVPYTSEYINDNDTQKVVFTKCELTDRNINNSSIVIRKYSATNFVTDSNMFTMSDEMTDNVTINVLTQDMITPLNVNRTNTIFKVQIDYDLQGQEIDIPVGCILQMDGGSINNGYLRGNDTVCTDFSTIGAELIGTWRNNDNERIDNGVRKPRKTDVKLSAYFYTGEHGAVTHRKVDIYRYTKKVGMGDVNMVVKYEHSGQSGLENRSVVLLPYQSVSNSNVDCIDAQGRNKWKLTHYTVQEGNEQKVYAKIEVPTVKHPLSATVISPTYLGLEENYNDNGEIKTRPIQLIPDTITKITANTQNPDGETYPYDTYYVQWGNADIIGLGLMLRLGVDNLSFVKFVMDDADDLESSYFIKPDNFNPVDSNKLTSEEEETVQALIEDTNADGSETIEKIKRHAAFINEYIERLETFGFTFTDVYVLNEAPIISGELYGNNERKTAIIDSIINDLIQPIKNKGYRVGATFSQILAYKNSEPRVFNALDEAGLNHYPILSYDDNNIADSDDMSEYNIIAIKNALRQDLRKKKMPLYITEGGCGSWKNALRAPMTPRSRCYYEHGGNNALDLDHSIPGHIFFKSLFKAAVALDAKKVNIWFPNNLENSHVEDVILNCFYK